MILLMCSLLTFFFKAAIIYFVEARLCLFCFVISFYDLCIESMTYGMYGWCIFLSSIALPSTMEACTHVYGLYACLLFICVCICCYELIWCVMWCGVVWRRT